MAIKAEKVSYKKPSKVSGIKMGKTTITKYKATPAGKPWEKEVKLTTKKATSPKLANPKTGLF